MEQTERARLPLLSAGQLQKELWVNESFLAIDMLICGQMVGQPVAEPPEDVVPLAWYRIDTHATGAWAGHAGELAISTSGGWRFLLPFEGLELTDVVDGSTWRFANGDWEDGVGRMAELRIGGNKVVGEQCAGISDPANGSVIDVEARTAISAILTVMRSHGLIA